MKGVLARLAPRAAVVDLCHEVPPQDIQAGGFLWAQAVPYFPAGCVHVAVVDPGVGTGRRILAFRGKGSLFLAPDNGLIGHVLAPREVEAAVEVRCRELCLQPVSATFHGRDIFAPVAAALCGGLGLDRLGPPAGRYVRGGVPAPVVRRGRGPGPVEAHVRGQVVHVDRFGNAITNVRPRPGWRLRAVEARGVSLPVGARTYGDAAPGAVLVLPGSAGHFEIAVRDGDAAAMLGLRAGDAVRFSFRRR
jgi:hypothetical protein